MEDFNSTNTKTFTNNEIPLQNLAENRIQALTSLTQLLLNELKLLERMHLRKDDFLSDKTVSLSEEVKNFEIELIRMALARAKGCQRTAARLLQTKNSTLCEKIKRYGIEPQGITFVAKAETEEENFLTARTFS